MISQKIFQGQKILRFVFSMGASPCDSVSLPSLAQVCLPFMDSPKVPLAPHYHLCLSYPLQCVLFSTFSCGFCYSNPQAFFWVIYIEVSIIQLYLQDKVSLGSSYFTISQQSTACWFWSALFITTFCYFNFNVPWYGPPVDFVGVPLLSGGGCFFPKLENFSTMSSLPFSHFSSSGLLIM